MLQKTIALSLPRMERTIWIAITVALLLLPGFTGPCGAADPQTAITASTEAATPKSPDTATKKDAASAPEPSSDQAHEVNKSITDQLPSLLKNPNIIKLWTENSLTNWILLLISIFAGMVAGKICAVLLHKAGSRTWAVPTKFLVDLAGPANLFLITLGLYLGFLGITMNKQLWNDFISKILLLLFYVSVFWYIYNLVSIVDALFHRISRKSDSSLEIHIAPLVRRSLRVFVVILAFMFIVQSVFDKDIGTWLAGLGIAGIAVSLAAQDSLKNLFGSITIIMDQSFKIGERIICSGCDGVIEDIGLRTTRVRTAGGHVISIPNANIVNSPIENVSRRPAIRRNFTLALKLDTPAEKVKLALKIVNDILADEQISKPIHPTINGQPSAPQVFFSDYTANSLNLNIAYWYAPPNNSEYMAHAEKINLRILEEFNRAGINMASP